MSEKKKYKVAVTETLRRVVAVEAANESEARHRASDAWHNGEIILEAEDLHGVEFYVLGEHDEDDSKQLERIDAKDGVLSAQEVNKDA